MKPEKEYGGSNLLEVCVHSRFNFSVLEHFCPLAVGLSRDLHVEHMSRGNFWMKVDRAPILLAHLTTRSVCVVLIFITKSLEFEREQTESIPQTLFFSNMPFLKSGLVPISHYS